MQSHWLFFVSNTMYRGIFIYHVFINITRIFKFCEWIWSKLSYESQLFDRFHFGLSAKIQSFTFENRQLTKCPWNVLYVDFRFSPSEYRYNLTYESIQLCLSGMKRLVKLIRLAFKNHFHFILSIFISIIWFDGHFRMKSEQKKTNYLRNIKWKINETSSRIVHNWLI